MNPAHIWCSINIYKMNEGLNGKKISMLETQKRKGLFLAGDTRGLTFELDFEEWVGFPVIT